MNAQIKQDTASLMALASKLDTRTNLFLQAVSLIHEHQAMNRRLMQQVLLLQSEVDNYATRSNPKPDGSRIQEGPREATGQDHSDPVGPGTAGNTP
jgi:hypothetical protein